MLWAIFLIFMGTYSYVLFININILFYFQAISLGPADASGQVAVAPDTTVQLSIIGCERVEILSKTFNAMPMLQNVTFQSFKTLDLHTRLYEARVGNGQAATIGNFEIEDVSQFCQCLNSKVIIFFKSHF